LFWLGKTITTDHIRSTQHNQQYPQKQAKTILRGITDTFSPKCNRTLGKISQRCRSSHLKRSQKSLYNWQYYQSIKWVGDFFCKNNILPYIVRKRENHLPFLKYILSITCPNIPHMKFTLSFYRFPILIHQPYRLKMLILKTILTPTIN